jgi:hypothetical protein
MIVVKCLTQTQRMNNSYCNLKVDPFHKLFKRVRSVTGCINKIEGFMK